MGAARAHKKEEGENAAVEGDLGVFSWASLLGRAPLWLRAL